MARDTAAAIAADAIEDGGVVAAIGFVLGEMARARSWHQFRGGVLLLGAILRQVVA